MTSHRRKLLPLCVALALLSGHAGAVGLGEIQLSSYLGKPLQAEIALNDMGDLSSDQLKVRIGSEADYQALGVEHTYLHSQLKLEPFVRNGHGYVRISTREPISEPFLNFVLTLQWPKGQVVREFTVLLDPAPVSAVAAVPSAIAPTSAFAASESTAEPREMAATAPVAKEHARHRPVRSQPSIPASEANVELTAAHDAYVVQRGDSLWRIASKLRPSGVSLEQTMSAIAARNPDAFINGDHGKLKEAAQIIAPSAAEIAGGAPAVAPTRAVASAPATSSAKIDGAAVASAPLAEENASLKAQVSDLSGNVAALNQSLAESQERLRTMETQLDNVLQQFQQQRATIAALSNGGETPAANTNAVVPVGGSMISHVSAAELRPTPVARMPWWMHLVYWLGIGAAVTWAIREHFWPQRRLALVGVGSEDGFPMAARGSVAPVAVRESRTVVESTSWQHDSIDDIVAAEPSDDEMVMTSVPASEPAPSLERHVDDPVDASISAGVFVAFGRFDEAERLLLDALKQVPERTDLKLQLLDVYMQADQREAFEVLAHEIEQGPTTPEVIAELAVLRDGYRSHL
ncbi:MAG: Peptidoglycan-binding LysM [Verrucomicrobiaceae bacterium]|nr:Peptidoglycan-binding LysM [Verrucomicrobiaceae bacterium]